MSIIAWIVLGAIAGYLAGVFFDSDPIDGAVDVSSIVVATIGAILTVVVVNMFTSRTRTGSGSI